MAKSSNTTQAPDRLVFPAEAREILLVSESTLKRLANSGSLPPAFRTLGGHRRFWLSAVHKVRDLMYGGEARSRQATAIAGPEYSASTGSA